MFGKRLFQNLKKHRLAVGGLCLLLAVLAVLAWTGYNLHYAVRNMPQYRMIHDGYVEKQAFIPTDPETGLVQVLPEEDGQILYGMRMMFATGGRVAQGSYTVQLVSGDQVLATAAGDMTRLLDGAFVDVLFDAPVVIQPGRNCALHISFAPATAEDVVGVVYGEGEQANPDLPLYEAGREDGPGRTMAMQYIINYTGSRLGIRMFVPVALILIATLMLGWWLIFVRKASVQIRFAVIAVGLGLIWAFVTPPLAGPDEYVHTAGAYNIVSGILGQPQLEGNQLPMRPCDAPYMQDHSGDTGPMVYKIMMDGILSHGNSGELTATAEVRAPYGVQPIQYLPQTMGILLARLLGLGFYPMLLLARICSVVAFAALVTLAIWLTPVGKELFFAAGLLPSCLSLAGSLSADPMVIGLAFAFTALCLRGKYDSKPFGMASQLGLILMAGLLAPSKAIYAVLILLCLIIPSDHMGGKTRSALVKMLVLAVSAAAWTVANGATLRSMLRSVDVGRLLWVGAALAVLAVLLFLCWKRWGKKPAFRRAAVIGVILVVLVGGLGAVWIMRNSGVQLTPEEYAAGMQPNGDSIYTFTVGYILSHPSQTLKLILNTVGDQLPVYLQGLMGALPGEPIVHHLELSWTLTIALFITLLMFGLRTADQPCRLSREVRAVLALIVLAVTALMVLACVGWTPINRNVVFGIQGRYLLPILPMALLWLGDCRLVQIRKECSSGLQMTLTLLGAASVLQALLLFAAV